MTLDLLIPVNTHQLHCPLRLHKQIACLRLSSMRRSRPASVGRGYGESTLASKARSCKNDPGRVLRILGLPFQADQFSFTLIRLDGRISMWMMLLLARQRAAALFGAAEKQSRRI